jgi:hypothetical protein
MTVPGFSMDTEFYKADWAWVTGVREQKYPIIDMGDPMKRGFSDFLNMEYEQTFEWARRKTP